MNPDDIEEGFSELESVGGRSHRPFASSHRPPESRHLSMVSHCAALGASQSDSNPTVTNVRITNTVSVARRVIRVDSGGGLGRK